MDLYFPMVYGWCQGAGVPTHDIADVVQEVFRAVAQSIDDFRRDRPSDTFRGWIRGITRHKVQDHWRSRPVEGRALGGSTALERLGDVAQFDASDGEQPEISATSQLVQRAVEHVRSEFEPATWQAFWRYAVDDESAADVAAAMGVSMNAIHQAKSRVLRRLREVLGDLLD